MILIIIPEIVVFEYYRILFNEGKPKYDEFGCSLYHRLNIHNINFELYKIVSLYDLSEGYVRVSILLKKLGGC